MLLDSVECKEHYSKFFFKKGIELQANQQFSKTRKKIEHGITYIHISREPTNSLVPLTACYTRYRRCRRRHVMGYQQFDSKMEKLELTKKNIFRPFR